MWPLEFEDQNMKLIRKLSKKVPSLSNNFRLAVISFVMKELIFAKKPLHC